MNSKYFLGLFILSLIFVFACSPQPPSSSSAQTTATQEKAVEKPAEKAAAQPKANPVLKTISPKDGELVKSSKIAVQLDAENFNLVPVGQPVKESEGHFHVWLDSEKKLGPEKTFTFENVVSGRHAIVAELVKSDHSSLSPKVTQTITINVESDFVPKVETAQQNANEFTVEVDDHGFYPNAIKAKVGDTIKINFNFRDSSIYFAGLDLKGPFPTLNYKLNGKQPLTASFKVEGPERIDSYWPSSGVHKATMFVQTS